MTDELLDTTHLCKLMDAANPPRKRGPYKKERGVKIRHYATEGWTTLKIIEGSDQKHYVAIERGGTQLFRFIGYAEVESDGEMVFAGIDKSGYYASADAAEAAARSDLPWLRDDRDPKVWDKFSN